MNSFLENQFRTQIKNLYGFEFQGFIIKLYLLKFGSNGFVSIRDTKDKGSDGFVISESRSISCYGPKTYSPKEAIKKIKDDFQEYANNWKSNYSNWSFIVNHELTPDEISTVSKLKQDAIPIGLTQIVNLIMNELNNFQRKEIGKYLKIDNQYLASDFIKELLDDLLKESAQVIAMPFKNAPYIPNKIELNFLSEDRDTITNSFLLANENFSLIENTLNSFDDGEIQKIKSKVILDFNIQTGSFKEKLYSIIERYSSKYDDDEYSLLINSLLLYIFEQCLIGMKTPQESPL